MAIQFARARYCPESFTLPVQPLKLRAGVGGGELPIGFDVLPVAAVLPGGDFLGQGQPIWGYGDRDIDQTTR